MRRLVLLMTAAACMIFGFTGMNAAAQRADETIGGTGSLAVEPKPAPALNETQRQQVWQAVMERATDAKLPEGFQPVVGVTMPTQANLPMHPLPGPLANEIPDPISRKVVEVITQ